ncbi:MAG: hypothetical protein U1F49_08445 [Rubrivivax sp.]
MRHQGHVIEWNDKRGSGFIAPSGGGAKVYLHVSALPRRTMRPRLGALLSYELGPDKRGRPRAHDVQFLSTRDIMLRGGQRLGIVGAVVGAVAMVLAAWVI